MTDQELLEKAAKAAGVHIVPCTCGNPNWPFKLDEQKSSKWGHWNPLENDRDAFRLAVKLQIDVKQYVDYVIAWSHGGYIGTGRIYYEGDPYTATRRAIVISAAHLADTQPAT